MTDSTIGTNKQTEAERLANIAELEKLNPNAPDKSEEDDDEGEAPPATDDQVTPPAETPPAETPPVVTPPAETPPTDYEKKFQDSSREAQVLALRNKTYQDKIAAAESLPDPTDEECVAEYGEAWEDRDDIDKGIARQVLKDRKYKDIIRSVHQEQKAEEEQYNTALEYAGDIDTTQQFPALKGRQEEFARFATKETRRGLALEDVAAIFVMSNPVARVVPKGAMMERSNANMNKSKPVPKTLDAAHLATLRQQSPKAYEKAIRDGTVDPTKMFD